MKKLTRLFVGGVLFAALPLAADTWTDQAGRTWTYQDNGDGTVTLSRYDDDGNWIEEPISPAPAGDFTIPAALDGKPVVAIVGEVFRNSELTSVVIPASVTNIGEFAFHDSYSLAQVTLNEGLVEIGPYAFAWCYSLTNATVPASTDAIGDYAFGWSGLATVTFVGGVENVASLSDYAFWETMYDRSLPFVMVIDESGAVTGYHGTCPATLAAADWPVGVTEIGENAFNGAYELGLAVIPAGVTNIGNRAFGYCGSLASVTFESGREGIEIDPGAFDFTPWGDANMPFVFRMNEERTEVYGWGGGNRPQRLEIPAGVTNISSYSFNNIGVWRELIVPASVEQIGDCAFSWCGGLTHAYLPKALEGVIDEANVFNSSPVTVYYYEGSEPTFVTVTLDAGEGTVDGATLRVLPGNGVGTLPTPTRDGYDFIGWFTAATGGDEVAAETVVAGDMTLYAQWQEIAYAYTYIDNGDGTVALHAYYDSENGCWVNAVSPAPVGAFTVPAEIDGKRVVGIVGEAFTGFWEMTSLTIPASVTNIEAFAIGQCGLTNIAVAAGNPAYKDVDGILYTKDGKTLVAFPSRRRAVVVAVGTERIGDHAFQYSIAESVVLPDGLKEIGAEAFNGNYNLASIVLPEGLEKIDYYAFAYCDNEDFTAISIPASMETIGLYAFGYCANLSTVAFEGTEDAIDIADTAFISTPYDAAKPFALLVDDGALVGFHGVAPENLVISNHLDGQALTGIGYAALSALNYNTASLTNVVVPEGVTLIDNSAFDSDMALESVTLPMSLQSICYGAFQGCSSLRTIWIPSGVMFIDDPFLDCENLATVYAPRTLEGLFSVPDGCEIIYRDIPQYAVTFNANGGTISTGDEDVESLDMSVLEGRTVIGQVSDPYREGFDFAGWFDADGNRVPFDFVVTSDVTLTARWREASPWDWSWDEYGVTISIVGARDGSVVVNGVLEIPASLTVLDGGEEVELPVVGIGSWAFQGWRQFSTLVLPASVERIDEGAFTGCQNLTNVVFGGGMDGIEMSVHSVFYGTPWLRARPFTLTTDEFEGDVYLTSWYGSPVPTDTLVVPAGVTVVRPYSLPWADDLPDGGWREENGEYIHFLGWYTATESGERVGWDEDVELAGGTTLYARWGKVTPEWYYAIEDEEAVIEGCSVPFGDMTIPASVTVEEADGEGNPVEVAYPVTAIDDGAFAGCGGLTGVTIPASVTRIGDWAFEDCSSLTNVAFAGDMDGIRMNVYHAFYGTPWLEAYLASLPRPANDDFANAAALVGASGRVTGRTYGATLEDGEADLCDFRGATVWFTWTAPKSGTVTFMTFGSDFEVVFGVYSGSVLNELEEIYISEDNHVSFSVEAGATYRIALGGYGSDGDDVERGDFVLSWEYAAYFEDGEALVSADGNDVTDDGDGSYTIAAPAGGTLGEETCAKVSVKKRYWGEGDGALVDVTAAYSVTLAGGEITVRPKPPEIASGIDANLRMAGDKTGLLADPAKLGPLPYFGYLADGEELAALPVRTVKGMRYLVSWGDDLDDMTPHWGIQADGDMTYLYVIMQTGTQGFYKVEVR